MSSPYSSYLDFQLPDDFIAVYAKRPVKWGFPDAAGNSLGELTFLRSYSRMIDGHKERWHEVCRRVTEGTYHEQRKFCKQNRLPWNWKKATTSAKEFYDSIFNMKWLPPGRGLWAMGTRSIHDTGNSSALQSCAFSSTDAMTKDHPETPFAFLMEASMLGIGVGFDTEGSKKNFTVYAPTKTPVPFVVEDTREGWVAAMSTVLRAYLINGQQLPKFDFSLVRKEGEPIKGFGGVASGPAPLAKLLTQMEDLLDKNVGSFLSSRIIVDISNMIGVCVVSGNVRRSSLLSLGDADDEDFITMKDYEKFPYRAGWGWMSNNSIRAENGMDYSPYIDTVVSNGEPGFVYLDLMRSHGRLIDAADHKDHRSVGTNPCSEQTLESKELCTLVETFPMNCTDKKDYLRTLKYAYMYGKTVTLIPTHWPETNAIMQRNRRIGTSMSGLAQFVEAHSRSELRDWMNEGYAEIKRLDTVYSEWLGIRESIKISSIKPSGSVSIVSGATPGVHWPVEKQYIRRIIFGKNDPVVVECRKAGYPVLPSTVNPDTSVVVEFPIMGPDVRTEREVSIFEKADLAALAQSYWADNQVSCTITFDRDTEAKHVPVVLRMFEDRLKSISFLPIDKTAYPQMPYEALDDAEYVKRSQSIKPINWNALYLTADDADAERGCTNDRCVL